MPELTLLVNGSEHRVQVDQGEMLLYVLRDKVGLTGTKYGCGEGECGACTVLLDGEPVKSCRRPAAAAAGKKITTIEGLAEGGKLHPVQQAFLDQEAMQCAYCTPGMIMAAVGLLGRSANPSEAEIVRGMSGNLCRCGTYPRIVAAVQQAAKGGRRG
jgi:aerobic-type carbon monoxide dehydrogenase small subunit (CoxS/CutS family)